MDKEKLLDKVRKLAAITADNGASEGEVVNASKIISDLMRKYSLSEAEVYASTKEQIDEYISGACNLVIGRFFQWNWNLGHAIATITHTRCYRSSVVGVSTTCAPERPSKPVAVEGKTLCFYGKASNVEVAVYLYEKWEAVFRAMASIETTKYIRAGGDAHPKSFWNGVLSGLSMGVLRKVYEQEAEYKKAAEAQAKSAEAKEETALAVYDEKIGQAFEQFKKDAGFKKAKNQKETGNNIAVMIGILAGQDLDLMAKELKKASDLLTV